MRVAIYGSRPDGHAHAVADVLAAGHDLTIVGLIDDHPENADRRVAGVGVIGTAADLVRLREEGVEGVLLGFGTPRGRGAVLDAIEAAGLQLPALVHPSAFLAESASLAPGAQVLPQASVGAGARIERGALVNTGAIVEHDVVLGPCAVLGPGAVLAGRVRVGHAVEIGAGAVVLPDVNVGAESVVGAGAVVNRDVAAAETVAGVPARPLS